MKRILLSTMMIVALWASITAETAYADTIVVPDDYPTIQQAVDAANPGDTIYVRAGTYTENVALDKVLTLQGEDRGTTIVDGGGSGSTLYVTSDGSTVSGLTIRNGNTGIYLWQADNCQLEDLLVTANVQNGIWMRASTHDTVINTISSYNGAAGFNLDDEGSHHNTFEHIEAYENAADGFVGYAGSNDIQIRDSRLHHNVSGITIGWSQYWSIEGNSIYSNTDNGVSLDTASNGTIRNNEIFDNYRGVRFAGLGEYNNLVVNNRIYSNDRGVSFEVRAQNNTVIENQIYDNNRGVYIYRHTGSYVNHSNIFYHNHFINNTIDALVEQDDYANTWDDGYPSGGNYWDDYTGVDFYSGAAQDQPGSDGIGDTPYVITPTLNIDHYPLVLLSATNDSPTILGQVTTLTATTSVSSSFVYTWTFGDGATGYGAVVTHTYPAVGTYTAVVTANSGVSLMTATTTVTIRTCWARSNESPTDYATVQAAVDAAAGDPVLFRDDFNGTLDDRWTILHHDPSYYTFAPDRMNLRANSGEIAGSATSYKNLFLIDTPTSGDFEVTMRVIEFVPAPYHAAQIDLFVYDDDDNLVRDLYGHPFGARHLEIGREIGGGWSSQWMSMDFDTAPFYLRLTKIGNIYTQYYSTDGVVYTQANSPVTYGDGTPAQVGFAAMVDPTESSVAQIDWFEVVALDFAPLVKVAGYCPGVQARAGLTQSVYLSKSLTIQGGYTVTNWTTPDPAANPTTLDAQSSGRVFYITGDITPTIEGLRITGGSAAGLGGGPGGTDAGGGMYVVTATATISSCQVFSNTAERGSGVSLWHSNSTFVNTLVTDNAAGTDGSGLYIDGSDARFLHTTLARNTAPGNGGGIYVTDDGTAYSHVALTNTILVSHTVGISVTAGSTAILEATLWGNDTDWGGNGDIYPGTINLWGNPAFIDPDGGDYHLDAPSAARDVGVPAGIFTDSDGDPRPLGSGYDLGMDEFIKLSVDDRYVTAQDTPLTVAAPGVLGNDTSVAGDTLTATLQSGPVHGTVELSLDGSFVYTPSIGFLGTDTFTYTASDGVLSDMAIVNIVVASNVCQEIQPDANTVFLDHLDGATIGEQVGPLSYAPSLPGLSQAGDFTVGTYVIYGPLPSGPLQDQATLEFWINPQHYGGLVNYNWNHVYYYPPAGHVLHVGIGNDGRLGYGVWGICPPSGCSLQGNAIVPLNQWTHVAISWSATESRIYINGQLDASVPGRLAPASPQWAYLNYWGGIDLGYVDEFHISDIQRSDAEIFAHANCRPMALDDIYNVDEDTTLVVPVPGVLGNDVDVNWHTLTATLDSPPLSGTLDFNADGAFVYTPTLNFDGTDGFTYIASDGALTDTAIVTLTIDGINDPPLAVDDGYGTDEDTPFTTGDVLVNDSDVEGPVTLDSYDDTGLLGLLSYNGDGTFDYDPDDQFEALGDGEEDYESFTYTISDTEGLTDTATVLITITGVDDPPMADDDVYTTTQDTPLMVAAPGVLDNDDDPEGDALQAMWDSGPGNGDLVLAADGSFIYTPTAGFSGVDTFGYYANDGLLDSNVATVTLNVMEAACTEVGTATLTLLTTGTIYPNDPVDFLLDLMPDDFTPPYSYTVDYDDGTVVSDVGSQDPMALTHSYTTTGTYQVMVEVWNCDMTVPVTATVEVVVYPEDVCVESIDIMGEVMGYTGVEYTFDTDYSPAGASLPISYTWDDGGTAASSSRTFDLTGTYELVVTATNCLDTVVTDTHTIVIEEEVVCTEVTAVSLSYTNTGTIYAGNMVYFVADLSPDEADPDYNYIVTIDGVPGAVMSSGTEPLAFQHTFDTTGTHTVEIMVWNCDMTLPNVVTATIEVEVYEPGVCVPLESISILGEAMGYTGVEYTFDTEYTPAGATPSISYTWDDGGTAASSSRTFDLTGTYNLVVTATNCPGGQNPPVTDTHTIVIEEMPPCVEVSGVDLTLVTTGDIHPGDQVEFDVDLIPDDATKPYSYTLDYGDGSGSVNGSGSDDPFSFSYTYTATGTYPVTFWAWNCGMTGMVSDSVQVVVTEPAPGSFAIYLSIVIKND